MPSRRILNRSSSSDSNDETDERRDIRLLMVEYRARGVVLFLDAGVATEGCSFAVRGRLGVRGRTVFDL